MAWILCGLNGGSGGIPFTLTVTTDEDFIGETLTLSNGTVTLEQTVPNSCTVVFSIPATGTWELSNSLTQQVEEIIVNADYECELTNVPDGKTVLPTDDIQIWLKCAGINDKSYTTLAEVLADNDTLLALITSDNAIDYMARSKTWTKSTAVVPTMTSNTTPSGEVIFSSSRGSDYAPWKAFDGNNSTIWQCYGIQAPQYIGYHSTQQFKVGYIRYRINGLRDQSGKIQGSNDGSTWVDLTEEVSFNQPSSNWYTESLTKNIDNYDRYRIYLTSIENKDGSNRYADFYEIQFYTEVGITENSTAMQYINSYDYAATTLLEDRDWCEAICNSEYSELVLNAKVPVMTSNTTPSGECSEAVSYGGNYPPYYAFDGNTSTKWVYGGSSTTTWIQYQFPSAITLAKMTFKGNTDSPYLVPTQIVVQGSNDGSTFTDLKTITDIAADSSDHEVSIGAVDAPYAYFRLLCTARSYSSAYYAQFCEIQFYGRQPGGVQTWLHKAGITDKNYTTLAEVLADTTTLAALMASEDAVDYLVTCKGWATAQALIPTMTSNTTPSGECFGNSHVYGSNYYYAFDDSSSTYVSANQNQVNGLLLGYKFTSPTNIGAIKFWNRQNNPDAPTYGISHYKLQGSNDNGSTWTDITGELVMGNPYSVEPWTQHISNASAFEMVALYVMNAWDGASTTQTTTLYCNINKIQFYSASITDSETAMSYIGLNNYCANTLLADSTWCEAICNSTYFESVLNAKVPVMTSDTTPSGVCSASRYPTSYNPYKAFNGSAYGWEPDAYAMSDNDWIQYQFPDDVAVYKFSLRAGAGGGTQTYKMQSSPDNSAFTDRSAEVTVTTPSSNPQWTDFIATSSAKVKYWRMLYVARQSTYNGWLQVQFYGRVDV